MSNALARPPSASGKRAFRAFFWILIALGLVAIVTFVGGRAWIARYLRSDRFRQFVSERTSETLKANGAFSPFKVAGTSFYSEEFVAHGGPEAWFAEMRIDQVRADVSARRFLEKIWQVDRVSAQRLEIALGGPRAALPPAASLPGGPARPRSKGRGWLPNRVEIENAQILEANLLWGDQPGNIGSIHGTSLTIHPREGGWDFSGAGGRLTHANLPPLDVTSLRLRYHESALFVQSAAFRQGATGTVNLNGEVRFQDAYELAAQFQGISITPLLGEDWRVRLRGDLGGEMTIRGPLAPRAPPVISGKVALEHGVLEALPVLDQIALFTRTQQFRRLALSKVTGEIRQEGEIIEVRNFIGESEGLLRVEGSFAIRAGKIDGTFQVGVTPASLQWLPGSQERVFTERRGGYIWTPMRLTGPLNKPQEDLSPRLIAAAQSAVIEGVETKVRDTIKTGRDAAKGALDLLMPLLK
ncbi:MAG TPA: hypothetical protein VFV83_05940 [Chthoniobacteraceae bacterium]|nr:hypothetical protein [Chthoniobacteraceae bacterium]